MTINGLKVNSDNGKDLSGSLPVSFNGEYVLRAVTAAGEESVVELALNVTGIPLTGGTVTAFPAWNTTRNNGTVTLDASDVIGGSYDPATSQPGKNKYSGSYEAALDDGSGNLTWTPLTKGSTAAEWTELIPGEYTVIIRDAADPTVTLEIPVTVADKALSASATVKNATRPGLANGKMIVTTTGGITDTVEVAILRAPAGYKPGQTMSPEKFAAQEGVVWQTADNTTGGSTTTFEGLYAGNYLVAVRTVTNGPDDPGSTCIVESFKVGNRFGSSGGNGSGGKPEPDTAIQDIRTDENGSVVFILEPGKDLTTADQATIRETNRTGNVVLDNGEASVLVPRGTLESPDFDLNRLIARVSDADGNVVEFTDPDGSTSVAAFGIVEDGKALYIAMAEGDYAPGTVEVSFDDIAGLWGEEDVLFTASRGIFLGTGEGIFSPDVTMSRAMFVTVLWRMMGSPEARQPAPFTDLRADWYKDAVAWAAEEGIVKGFSPTEFGPDKPVTREQMCVFMARFMEYTGWSLDRTAADTEFTDSAQISDWAKDAVAECASAGLIRGVGEGRVAPQKSATRMEVSAILARFIRLLVEQYCG